MKVYSRWAFDPDAASKSESNTRTYNELMSKYRVHKCLISEDHIDMDSYDVVLALAGCGYAESYYRVLKNAPDLTNDVLCLLCDDGNLCFGHNVRYELKEPGHTENGFVKFLVIYTD